MNRKAVFTLMQALLILALVACVPSVSDRITDSYNDRFSDGQTTLFLEKVEGFIVLTYSPGLIPHDEPVITVVGDNLQFNSRECVPNPRGVDCYPGSFVDGVRVMGVNRTFTLSMLGREIVANASYRHPESSHTFSQIAEVR